MPVEDCLIAIATLRDDEIPSIPARIAERLEISLPSVSETLKRLERDGYVVQQHIENARRKGPARPEYRLSERGQEIADTLMRRHRLIERWLTDVLRLDWAAAHAEAHRLEHAVSDLVADQLNESMGFPTSCPHGNPISRFSGDNSSLTRLSEAEPGSHVTLRRISERAEDNADLMTYYEREGLRPGADIRVRERAPLGRALSIVVDGRDLILPTDEASYLWVAAAELVPA